MSTLEQQILKEFGENFLTEVSDMTRSGKRLICDPDFAKQFITSALKRQHQADMEEVEDKIKKEKKKNTYQDSWISGWNDAIYEIINIIKINV